MVIIYLYSELTILDCSTCANYQPNSTCSHVEYHAVSYYQLAVWPSSSATTVFTEWRSYGNWVLKQKQWTQTIHTTFLFHVLQLKLHLCPLIFTSVQVLQDTVDIDKRPIHHDNRITSSSSSVCMLTCWHHVSTESWMWWWLQPWQVTYIQHILHLTRNIVTMWLKPHRSVTVHFKVIWINMAIYISLYQFSRTTGLQDFTKQSTTLGYFHGNHL